MVTFSLSSLVTTRLSFLPATSVNHRLRSFTYARRPVADDERFVAPGLNISAMTPTLASAAITNVSDPREKVIRRPSGVQEGKDSGSRVSVRRVRELSDRFNVQRS